MTDKKPKLSTLITVVITFVIAAVGGFITNDVVMTDEVTAIYANVDKAVEGKVVVEAFIVSPDQLVTIEPTVANTTQISISNIKQAIPNYMASNELGALITVMRVE